MTKTTMSKQEIIATYAMHEGDTGLQTLIKEHIIELEKELEVALDSWKLHDSFQGDWDWYVDQLIQLESDIELYEKLLTRVAVIKDGCIYIRGAHAPKMAAAIEAKGIFSYW